MEDKRLTCKICSNYFVWKAGEQQFYHDRNLLQPTRCLNCRKDKQQRREENLNGLFQGPGWDIYSQFITF